MTVMVREAAKSKLIERLKEISRGAPAPLGFGRPHEVALPALLLVAVLPRNDSTLAEAAARAGADAVVLRICGAATDLLGETGDLSAEAPQIKETLAAVGGTAIVGLIVGSSGHLTAEALQETEGLGVDFVAAYPHLTPANFLELKGVGRLAILDQQGGQLARGINDLPIQSALVRIGRPPDSPPEMTVLDVALSRAAADAIHRPIIAFPSWTLAPGDLEVLRDAGVEGVALVGPSPDADAATIEAGVRTYREKVLQLGKPKGRRVALTNGPVILPKAVPAAAAAEEDDDTDEDE
ncbi:MAG TPA: hypothetical protein VNL16_11810 [Chloroflexota bacterium]|nr:hypothetical protein [Chloroflexota bacterium]